MIVRYAPEAKGHGVPEVLDATYYHKGAIRPIVAVIKSIASSLSIGSGGSAGREGPMVQIGASFGSTVGQFLRLPAWQTVTLIAAGGGGGIAATFNTPLGGLLFAVELMMQEVSVRTMVPVVISTVTATYIGQYFFGTHPAFVIPSLEIQFFKLGTPISALFYILLGLILGAASALFIRTLYLTEDLLERFIKKNYYLRHAFGMLIVGITIYSLYVFSGHYHVEGVGYASIQDILEGAHTGFLFLLVLFTLKLIATSLTLGSGGSGGILSPSLFMGAAIGGAYGALLGHLFPGLGITPPPFAVAGMAGMIGGATGAAIMPIVMIFEMTLDYSVMVPMVTTVIISYGTRKLLSKDSIYTLKLTRIGHNVPEALKADFTQLKKARDIMDNNVSKIPAGTALKDFALIALNQKEVIWYVIEQKKTAAGIISRMHALNAIGPEGGDTLVENVAEKDYILVRPTDLALDIYEVMNSKKAALALVTEKKVPPAPEEIMGVITSDRVKWAVGG